MSMIEKMARAGFAEHAKGSHVRVLPWEAQDQRDRDQHIAAVRAMLAVIREPDEAMCAAPCEIGIGPKTSRRAWQAMIDAALKDPTK